ncbi:hypothetical protein Anapl_02030 [Anas platyrhynchos]|uniref:Uncharacterized protein n=1 Tax=Anas platyrhynchos TaxID=8839 RepID=R0KB04_ANAPL|nr:hypothetical protein Anapl_02030 [Anas platyrhynchos]
MQAQNVSAQDSGTDTSRELELPKEDIQELISESHPGAQISRKATIAVRLCHLLFTHLWTDAAQIPSEPGVAQARFLPRTMTLKIKALCPVLGGNTGSFRICSAQLVISGVTVYPDHPGSVFFSISMSSNFPLGGFKPDPDSIYTLALNQTVAISAVIDASVKQRELESSCAASTCTEQHHRHGSPVWSESSKSRKDCQRAQSVQTAGSQSEKIKMLKIAAPPLPMLLKSSVHIQITCASCFLHYFCCCLRAASVPAIEEEEEARTDKTVFLPHPSLAVQTFAAAKNSSCKEIPALDL